MRVLVIHTKYKFKGGEDIVVAEETRLLKLKGVDVELLEFTNDGSSFWKLIQLPFNIISYFKTKRFLKLYKPDIVHIHNLHFAASASVIYAVKKLKIPSVFTMHNYRLLCPSATLFHKGKPFHNSLNSNFPWSAVFNGVYNNSKMLSFWLGFATWLHNKIGTWKLVDCFIILTSHTREVIKRSMFKIEPSKIVVKPNFISDITSTTTMRSNHFLYVGRLSHEKGIYILLNAFRNSNHSITIVGDGPLKKEVAAFAYNHPNVTYMGFKDPITIGLELSKCSALVFPSVWYETFGLTIIEAFSAFTPVIASNIGAASILIEDGFNGLHFKASDVDDLKATLDKWMIMGDEEKEVYRWNARKTYEQNYTSENNFKQLISIYESVINHKRVA